MHKFGVCTYRPGNDALSLIAEWVVDDETEHSKDVGIGLAKLKKAGSQAFVGEYEVEYWLAGATVKLKLVIKKSGAIYKLEWSDGEKITNTGFGFVSGDQLVAGYTRG